jgi:hypothetical protein
MKNIKLLNIIRKNLIIKEGKYGIK